MEVRAGSSLVASSGSTSDSSGTVRGLSRGATYTVTVVAFNGGGSGPASPARTVTMLDVPDAPRSLTATAGSGEIRLDWGAPSSNGGTEVRYYEIERTVDGADWSDHWYVSSTGVTRTVTDLTNGIPYFYRVSAVSSVGTSAASNVVTATPRTVPSAVRSLREAAAADDLTGLAVVGHLLVHAVEPPRLGDPPGVVAGLVTGRPPAVVPRDHGVVVVHEPQVGGVARPDRDETEPRDQQRSLGPGHPAQPCHRSAFEHTAFATISV